MPAFSNWPSDGSKKVPSSAAGKVPGVHVSGTVRLCVLNISRYPTSGAAEAVGTEPRMASNVRESEATAIVTSK